MKLLTIATSLAVLTAVTSSRAADLNMDLGCVPSDAPLSYLCAIAVTDGDGRAIENAAITLTADMPAMAMAHNVSPVAVAPVEGRPGSYQGLLKLEMPGEWAVRATFAAPRRDVIVRKLDFRKDGVTPADRR